MTLIQRLAEAAAHAEQETERRCGWCQIELVLADDGVLVKGRRIAWSGRTMLTRVPWPVLNDAVCNPLVAEIDSMVEALVS